MLQLSDSGGFWRFGPDSLPEAPGTPPWRLLRDLSSSAAGGGARGFLPLRLHSPSWTRAHSHILKSPALHPLGHAGQERTRWKPRNLGAVKEISPSALRISLCTSSPGSWWTLVATGVLGAASLWFCWGWIRESRSSPTGTTGATGGSQRARVTLLMQEESEWFPPSFLGRQQNPTRGAVVFSDS
ncbi:uncharacterized protein LOC115896793 isoform X4 [Rhinopithecus roxellana]|uniref:uncharacterized protein LOC115896793 isoform X4 n=1 Tax=Rhinopithecus roxellana TaxID=61622 RepID=UPI0012374701|nr:uncharacterized protein LOC115896793 isoform X4 [Rhinopithecus roxellana]